MIMHPAKKVLTDWDQLWTLGTDRIYWYVQEFAAFLLLLDGAVGTMQPSFSWLTITASKRTLGPWTDQGQG